jgi:glycosyltransferase involved in cell wall biosynthesis
LLRTVPHGFDPASFESPAREDIRRKFKLPDDAVLIAFHGTFSYPPNRDALQVFAHTLLPLLEGDAPAIHVIAIGRNPPTENLHERIHFTGSVEEVGPWLKACDLAVVPLREGGGTRMKIVDCFAAGLPVISTRKGIEGIPVVDGREAIICDEWAEMAAAIRRLAQSSAEREQLSAAGLAYAAGLDWDSIASSYGKIYAAIRRSGTPSGQSGPQRPENAGG